MFSIKDQLGRDVNLKNYPPQRIISLVPSQTELLHSLGLEQEVVGITKFCVHPRAWFATKEKVGGTKKISIDKIRSLQPDLVIANKEENVKEQVEQLEEIAPVWVSDVNNFSDALKMIRSVGELTGRNTQAEKTAGEIEIRFCRLADENYRMRTAYLIWQNPYMAAAGDTFIGDMLRKCGFENILEHEERYPEITLPELAKKHCELVILSSEPFPFRKKDADEIKSQLPKTRIVFADGEMFSWYGSRMLHAAGYFRDLLDHIYESPANRSRNA